MSATTAKKSDQKKLAWTGERMIPNKADILTEMYHWQRYLYFRPWYQEKVVIDAACGEGYGTGYAATFAKEAFGFDIATDAIDHATHVYPHASFAVADCCNVDYSHADLVVSFETIEHLPDPEKFLEALKSCKGRIVISTPNREFHSPGNKLSDKPLNEHHTIEWTPQEFADLINAHFSDRQVRFVSQEDRWPGIIREGLDQKARYTIAVIGEGDLPFWPRIGLSMPTHNNADWVQQSILSFSKFYPGELKFAVVSNGCHEITRAKLNNFHVQVPHLFDLVECDTNLGYGMGANRGLNHLWQEEWFDYFGVTNDDVVPHHDCLPQLVSAFSELEAGEFRPGILGPVSNRVAGRQLVEFAPAKDFEQLMDFASLHHRQHHSEATQVFQVRGLLALIHPDALSEIGGFDPIFGLGNFEDDDWNIRAKLAGYSLWVADGAFLYHEGSTTFKKLNLDYEANINRNGAIFLEKWQSENGHEAFALEALPEGTDLYVPLLAEAPNSNFKFQTNGETIDLVYQATEVDFAAWVIANLRNQPRTSRLHVLNALKKAASKAA